MAREKQYIENLESNNSEKFWMFEMKNGLI